MPTHYNHRHLPQQSTKHGVGWQGHLAAPPPPKNCPGTFRCKQLKPRTTSLRDTTRCDSAARRHLFDRTRSPHWSWGRPGRYYDRAGYRNDFQWRQEHPQRPLRPRRHICLTAYAGWLTVHARRPHGEVCPLSGGVRFQPLSGPLPAGLRFLPDPLPAVPSVALASRLPRGEDDGLTTFRRGNARVV